MSRSLMVMGSGLSLRLGGRYCLERIGRTKPAVRSMVRSARHRIRPAPVYFARAQPPRPHPTQFVGQARVPTRVPVSVYRRHFWPLPELCGRSISFRSNGEEWMHPRICSGRGQPRPKPKTGSSNDKHAGVSRNANRLRTAAQTDFGGRPAGKALSLLGGIGLAFGVCSRPGRHYPTQEVISYGCVCDCPF
jgi:hypothetical protein